MRTVPVVPSRSKTALAGKDLAKAWVAPRLAALLAPRAAMALAVLDFP
jgi:hypothetical protein